MSSAWLLPEHIADVLPARARQIESLRRGLLDTADRFGFELVIPPMLEHIESLLSGTGHALDLQTFKLVDQLSGRTLGLRPTARRKGTDRCPHAQPHRRGPPLLLRTGAARAALGSAATRELLQFGAEIYGHQAWARISRSRARARMPAGRRIGDIVLDLADARIVRAVLAGVPVDGERLDAVYDALAPRTVPRSGPRQDLPRCRAARLDALVCLYGDEAVLDEPCACFRTVRSSPPRLPTCVVSPSTRAKPSSHPGELRSRRLERLRLLQRRARSRSTQGCERRDRPRRPL